MNTDIFDTSSTEPAKMSAYSMLDAWRGFAALWVVMVHACLPQIAGEAPELVHSPLYAVSLWGQLGVTLFFVISGYCIASAAHNSLHRSNPVLYFVKGRIRRIYPPYFFAFLLTIVLGQLVIFLASKGVWHLPHHASHSIFSYNALYFVANLTITQIPLHTETFLIVTWTLCYEIAFYAILALCLLPRYKGPDYKTVLISTFAITSLSLVWLIAAPQTCPFPLNRWPQFGIGVLVFYYLLLPNQLYPRVFFITSTILMGLFAVFRSYGSSLGHPSSRIQSMVCISFSILLIVLRPYDSILSNSKYIKAIGKIGIFSYSLYLTHTIVQPFVHQAGKMLHISPATYWVSFWAQILISIIFAYIFNVFFERPFQISKRQSNSLQAQEPA